MNEPYNNRKETCESAEQAKTEPVKGRELSVDELEKVSGGNVKRSEEKIQ